MVSGLLKMKMRKKRQRERHDEGEVGVSRWNNSLKACQNLMDVCVCVCGGRVREEENVVNLDDLVKSPQNPSELDSC